MKIVNKSPNSRSLTAWRGRFPAVLAVLGLVALTSVSFEALADEGNAPERRVGGAVTAFVRGPGGSMIMADTPLSTPLWDSRFGRAAVAPDGHQLTLGEWTQVQPRAAMKCIQEGTHVTIHVSGLIPDGVYTVWMLIFDGPFGVAAPGKPAPFGHLVGIGSLGANDGSQNAFQASASGQGQISVIVPPQAPSSTGPPFLNNRYILEGCLLDEIGVHLSGVYHFDGESHGSDPGFINGAAEAFAVRFHP
jgi:hypothetical protein